MKNIYWSIVTFMLFAICAPVWSGAPTYRQGENIFIETGVTPPDRINDILSRPLEESYQAQVIEGFKWKEWADSSKAVANPHKRGDIRPKNYPYRGRPIEGNKAMKQ